MAVCMSCYCRKYHILRYEPIANSPLLHHGVAYTCDAKAAAAVKALKSMGPFDRCAVSAAAAFDTPYLILGLAAAGCMTCESRFQLGHVACGPDVCGWVHPKLCVVILLLDLLALTAGSSTIWSVSSSTW
jgi:hypothetical protein